MFRLQILHKKKTKFSGEGKKLQTKNTKCKQSQYETDTKNMTRVGFHGLNFNTSQRTAYSIEIISMS